MSSLSHRERVWTAAYASPNGRVERRSHSSPSRLRNRSLARSVSAGRGSAVNGSGRVTSMAARPEPRGQQAVEHAFAEPLRQFCGEAVAEHLLDQAVAGRHAAGDGDVRDDVAHQPDHAERAGPAAIEPRQLPDQPQRGGEHEQHVDQRARADGGDDRDALRGRRNQPARLLESSGVISSRSARRIMSAPSMMSSAWPCSAARARARCGFWCASLQEVLHDGAAFARSSLASTSMARRCSFSMVASRVSPSASRAITTTERERGGKGQSRARESRGFRCAQTGPRSAG